MRRHVRSEAAAFRAEGRSIPSMGALAGFTAILVLNVLSAILSLAGGL